MQIEKMIIDLMKPETMFHWGRTIVSTEPTTGVGNLPDIGHLYGDVHNNGIDPIFEEYVKEHPDEELYEWESTELYYGFIQAEDGKYDINPDAPFAVIWSDWAGGTYSIIKSPYVQFCTPCSPCCPGQVSLGQPGNYLGFSPSIEDFDKDDTDLPEVWVWDLEYELKRMELMLENNQRFYKFALNTPKYPCDRREEMKKRIEILIPLVGALSSALAENQKNTKQRILVKQQRIE